MNKTRDELVSDLHRRVSDHILEPSNAALLEKLIRHADDDNEAVMIASLGTTYKRTGLHFDKRLEKPTSDIHYFRRNEALSFGNDPDPHRLVIGDNLHALQNLLIQYRGKVDVIYIDPPYGKDSMGQFADTNYQNAITRDNLLSMLHPRLILARQLLSGSGVIFCSIDDRNQAYVKCLFDDVFGERNFISNSIIINNRGGRDYGGIAIQHEYMLIYAKNCEMYEFNEIEERDKQFQYLDELGGYNLMELRNRNVKFNDKNRPNLFYPFYLNPTSKDKKGLYQIALERSEVFSVEVLPAISQGIQTVWRWGKEEKARDGLNNTIFGKENQNGGYMIVQKYRKATKMQRSVWDEKEFVSERGTEVVKDVIGQGVFDYPKSVCLLTRVLELSTHEDSLCLDFFAGSGSFGQAVLDQNRLDGGNRRFILCQLNEVTDTTPNGIAHDVTVERLRRVMTGRASNGSADFPWVQHNQPYGGSLEVVDIATVSNFNALDGQSAFDVIDETLYGQPKFDAMEQKVNWVCQNFAATQSSLETDTEWQARRMEAENQ